MLRRKIAGFVVATFAMQQAQGACDANISSSDRVSDVRAKLACFAEEGKKQQQEIEALKSALSNPKTALPPGTDVLFYLAPVHSAKLWARADYVYDEKWDIECRAAAVKSFLALGLSLHDVPSNIGVRGEVDGMYLGVQCESGYSNAIVFGLSTKAYYTRLRAYATSLTEQLKTNAAFK